MGPVEMAQTDSSLSDEIVVADHDANDGSKKDGERRQDRDKGRCFVDQLPRLNNPGCDKCDDSSTAYIFDAHVSNSALQDGSPRLFSKMDLPM